jgi:hypothetical protein
VSTSCFALANKSPFSRGFGSLQICSVHQQVPSSPRHDFWLAGLRRDALTARAPGIFREIPETDEELFDGDKSKIAGKRLPGEFFFNAMNAQLSAYCAYVITAEKVPELFFQVVDRGDLDGSTPVAANQMSITVAPEVVHLSRFAKGYKLHPDNELSSRVDVCLHNGGVAESLQQVRTTGRLFCFQGCRLTLNNREI